MMAEVWQKYLPINLNDYIVPEEMTKNLNLNKGIVQTPNEPLRAVECAGAVIMQICSGNHSGTIN